MRFCLRLRRIKLLTCTVLRHKSLTVVAENGILARLPAKLLQLPACLLFRPCGQEAEALSPRCPARVRP